MHNIGSVIMFEITRTLKKPSFWLVSLSFPVLIGFLIALMYFSNKTTSDAAEKLAKQSFSIAVLDEANFLKPELVKRLNAKMVQNKQAAMDDVTAGRLDAFYYYPSETGTRPIEVYARDVGLFENSRYGAVSSELAMQSATSRVTKQDIGAVQGKLPTMVTTYRNGKPYDPMKEAIAPGLFLVLFYLLIAGFGGQMLTSTTEEKENRVIEMILTTVNARTLIVGKIISLIVLGVIQSIVVVVPIVIIMIAFSGALTPVTQSSPMLTQIVGVFQSSINVGRVVTGAVIFALSFMLFTGLLVMIGAATPTAKEASGYFGAVMLFVFGPLYAFSLFVSSPESPLVQGMTYFPLTAPIPLFIRNAVGNLAAHELAIALGILVITSVFVVYMAVNVFKTGVLEYNRTLKVKELFRRS